MYFHPKNRSRDFRYPIHHSHVFNFLSKNFKCQNGIIIGHIWGLRLSFEFLFLIGKPSRQPWYILRTHFEFYFFQDAIYRTKCTRTAYPTIICQFAFGNCISNCSRALTGNLKLGGLEIFFQRIYGWRFFKNHCLQKVVREFLINSPILNCQRTWICSATFCFYCHYFLR